MAEPVYKVLSEAAFEAAWTAGRFDGSTDDARDGFIHFSAGHQLAARSPRISPGGRISFWLRSMRIGLGHRLKWEPSRGGALFPHLYGPRPCAVLLERAAAARRRRAPRLPRSVLP